MPYLLDVEHSAVRLKLSLITWLELTEIILYHLIRVLFDLNNDEYFGHGEHMISLFDYVSMFLTGRKTLQTSENDVIHGLVYWKKNLVHDENGKGKQQLLPAVL